MEDSVFFKYHTARSLHKELTNIYLLCIKESNYYYCYCNTNEIVIVHFADFVSILEMAKLIICRANSFYS